MVANAAVVGTFWIKKTTIVGRHWSTRKYFSSGLWKMTNEDANEPTTWMCSWHLWRGIEKKTSILRVRPSTWKNFLTKIHCCFGTNDNERNWEIVGCPNRIVSIYLLTFSSNWKTKIAIVIDLFVSLCRRKQTLAGDKFVLQKKVFNVQPDTEIGVLKARTRVSNGNTRGN